MSIERKKLIVGNWKMEMSHKGEVEVARSLKKLLKNVRGDAVEVVVCPSFPSLAAVADELKSDGKMSVGAQNVHWEEKGANTGSVSMLQVGPFVEWCIVGHSEQRALTHVDDDKVSKTADMLLRHGIVPIVCIGETRDERDDDRTVEKVTEQMRVLFSAMTRTALTKLVVVYEPIWAISSNGPGELPDPADVAGIMLLMRKIAAQNFGNEGAEKLRILYGGSVKPDNVEAYIQEPGVDGVLVGKASTHPRDFMEIVSTVQLAAQ